MCARVYLNGDGSGKGSHISMSAEVMPGEFDDQLEWPFPWRITFRLLNKSGDEHHSYTVIPEPTIRAFQRPTLDRRNPPAGCDCFVPHADAERHPYMDNDDTVCLQVEVERTG